MTLLCGPAGETAQTCNLEGGHPDKSRVRQTVPEICNLALVPTLRNPTYASLGTGPQNAVQWDLAATGTLHLTS